MRRLVLVLWLLAGCGGNWAQNVVRLEVTGVSWRGERTSPETWTAEGVALGGGLVAVRAVDVVGARSLAGVGAGAGLSRVLHLDQAADLALLAGDGAVGAPAACVGLERRVVGGGIDGLVVDSQSGCLLGTSVAGDFVPRPDRLHPAGRDVAQVLGPLDLHALVEAGTTRRACLEPGEALSVAVGDLWPSVLTVRVTPEGAPLGAALLTGASVAWKGLARSQILLAFDRRTLRAPRGASVMVVNPARASARACATVDVGEVSFERALGRRQLRASVDGAPPAEIADLDAALPDEELLAAAVVAVVPRLPQSQTQRALGQLLAAQVAPVPGEFSPPSHEAPSGLSFGGRSDAADLLALHAGYVVGRMTSQAAAGEVAALQQLARWLAARSGSLAFLSEDLNRALALFIEEAAAGRVDAARVAELLAAAEAGIGAGAERAHGYFASGVWSGVALASAASPAGRQTVAAAGSNLLEFLVRDAAAGGSDLRVAERVRAVLGELSSPSPQVTRVEAEGRALMALRPYAE